MRVGGDSYVQDKCLHSVRLSLTELEDIHIVVTSDVASIF